MDVRDAASVSVRKANLLHNPELGRHHKTNRGIEGIYLTKTHRKLRYHSLLQRDAYLMLDFHPSVYDILEDRLAVDHYTATCTVLGREKMVIDVEYEARLIDAWLQEPEVYSRMNEYCVKHDLTFGFVTDFTVYYVDRHRLRVLRQLRYLANHKRNKDNEHRILPILQQKGPQPINALLRVLESSPRSASALITISHLLLAGIITIIQSPTGNPLDSIVTTVEDSKLSQLPPLVINYRHMVDRIRTHPFYRLRRGPITVVS